MLDLNRGAFKFPVGREKALSPLGHSGHLRLHAVVGSIEMVIGCPQCMADFVHLDKKYELTSWV